MFQGILKFQTLRFYLDGLEKRANGLFLYLQNMSNPHNPEEFIAIIDDNDNIIGKYRIKNHAEGKLHRETSVLIVNPNNEILVQERADNNLLDYSASGHFSFDENYLDGIIREVQEELGLNIPKSKFVKISKHRIDYAGKYVNNRFITLWEVRGNYKIEDMKIDPSEVKSVRYVAVSELKQIIKEKPDSMTDGFIKSLQIYFTSLEVLGRKIFIENFSAKRQQSNKLKTCLLWLFV